MGYNSKAKLNEAEFQRYYTYSQYYENLFELVTSSIAWENLPKGISARFLEVTLASRGGICFFKDPDISESGFMCLPFTVNGALDVFTEPHKIRAFSTTGYSRDLTNHEDAVIVWNNYARNNSILMIDMYARRLADYDRSVDVNAKAQKTPVLVLCDEKQKAVLKQVYEKVDGNAPVIFGNSNLDVKGITAVQTGAPFVADKLHSLKRDIWDEALTFLGISNIAENKRERLIVSEVESSQGGIIGMREARMLARRNGAEEIKDLFGVDLKPVFFQEKYEQQAREQSMQQQQQFTQQEGGEKDE